MYDLKKIQTIASTSIAKQPLARLVIRPRQRSQRAINVRNPRMMMGLIFLILLLSYLIAYAQDYAGAPQPYLTIQQVPAQQVPQPGQVVAQPDQAVPVPVTGKP